MGSFKLKVGYIYYDIKSKELFKIISKNNESVFNMESINHVGSNDHWKEEVIPEFVTFIGEGELEDYPEYFL